MTLIDSLDAECEWNGEIPNVIEPASLVERVQTPKKAPHSKKIPTRRGYDLQMRELQEMVEGGPPRYNFKKRHPNYKSTFEMIYNPLAYFVSTSSLIGLTIAGFIGFKYGSHYLLDPWCNPIIESVAEYCIGVAGSVAGFTSAVLMDRINLGARLQYIGKEMLTISDRIKDRARDRTPG